MRWVSGTNVTRLTLGDLLFWPSGLSWAETSGEGTAEVSRDHTYRERTRCRVEQDSRTGTGYSMPGRDTGRPDGKPARPWKVGGGTAEVPGHACQAGTAWNDGARRWPAMEMEEVLRRENMVKAYQRVTRNIGNWINLRQITVRREVSGTRQR